MKKLIYGGLFLALVGIVLFACKKEKVSLDDNSSRSVNKTFEKDQNHTKSGDDDFYLMAQAANIKSITYNEDNTYTVTTYLNPDSYYTVSPEIVVPDSLIEMSVVSSNNNQYTFQVDVSNSFVKISGESGYTFDNYIKSGITIDQPFNKNLVAIMSVYSAKYAGETTTFGDNGNDDTFDPPAMHPAFGWERSRVFVDFGDGCVTFIQERHYIFWIRVGKKPVSTIIPCDEYNG